MTRFGCLLVLFAATAAVPASAQDKSPETAPPPREVPKKMDPAPVPVADVLPMAPITEVFLPMAPVRPNFTFTPQLLQWWYKSDAIPPLLNTGNETSAGVVGGVVPGTLSDPNAITLFGSPQYRYHTVPGIRLDVGVAMTENVDIEYNGFLMERRSINAGFAGVNGSPFLTRPFDDVRDLVESGYDTSSKFGFNGQPVPGISGDIFFRATNQLYGNELNIAFFGPWENSKAEKILFGFRQIHLGESLTITENVSVNGNQAGPVLAFYPSTDPITGVLNANFDPTTQSIRIVDGYQTRNEFYGLQMGGQWRWCRKVCSIDFLAKFAVGVNHETISALGTTSRLTNGVVDSTGAGGLLNVSTNSGFRTLNELTVVPEIGIKGNFDLTKHIRLSAGYNMLYMTSVVRPGSQIDRRINPELVPHDVAYNPSTAGPFLPRGFFRDTDFYAHGVSFGLEVRY